MTVRKCIKILFAAVIAVVLMSTSVISASDGLEKHKTNTEETDKDNSQKAETDGISEDASLANETDEAEANDGGKAADNTIKNTESTDKTQNSENSGKTEKAEDTENTENSGKTESKENAKNAEATDEDSKTLNDDIRCDDTSFKHKGVFIESDVKFTDKGEVILDIKEPLMSASDDGLMLETANAAMANGTADYLTQVVYVNITDTVFTPPSPYLGSSNFGTHAFYIDGQFAWCCIPDATAPPSTRAVVYEVSNEILEKLLYIAPGTSHFRSDVLNVLSGGICGTDGESQVFIYHMAVAKLMGYDMTGNTEIISPLGAALVDELINWVIAYKDVITVPSYLKTVYYEPVSTAEVNYQSIVVQYDMTILEGSVTVKKVDENGDPLSGATFRADSYNAVSKSWDELGFFTDNGDGTYTIDLNYTEENKGYFRIIEAKAPNGYTRTKGYRYIRLTENGQNITTATTSRTGTEAISLIWEDTPFTAQVTVKKKDTDGQMLAGAVFTVYEWSKAKSSFVKYGKMTDNGDGTYALDVSFSQDNIGRFRVRETKAPAGYNRDSAAYLYFTITANNQKITKGTDASGTVTYDLIWTDTKIVEEEPEPLKFNITIDKLLFSDDLLKGHGDAIFAFKIEGVDDNGENITLHRIISFDGENGQGEIMRSVTIEGLTSGTYTITELESDRYSLVSINPVTSNVRAVIEESGIYKDGIETIKGKATIELTDGDAEVIFTNRKTDWSDYSDSTFTENAFRTS